MLAKQQMAFCIEGTVQKMHFTGAEAGGQTYFIYLPAGYESGHQRYQTLYHLHGADVQERVGDICNYIGAKVESAASAGIIEPTIVVCAIDLEGNRLWSDSFDRRVLSWTAFIRDLIPHIDKTYRTIPERSGRALQGFSMGGFGAVMNGFRVPELFSAIIIWDGALHNWQTISTMRPKFTSEMFGTEAYFNQWSPWELSKNSLDVDLDIFMVASKAGIIKNCSARFQNHLENLGRDFTYVDTPCPHSIFRLMAYSSKEAFSFLADSFARLRGPS